MVSEDTVIGWAHDLLVNDAFYNLPEDQRDKEGAIERFSKTIKKPTVEDAIYILEDAGACTFARNKQC